MSAIGKNILLLLASAMIMTGLAEAALRLLQPSGTVRTINELSVADPVLNHVHPRNTEFRYISPRKEFDTRVSFNSFGMRDHEYPKKKPEGAYRILVLGDSFVENSQVDLEKAFPKVLEKKLNRTHGKRFEVLNAGVASYSPGVEYLYLRNEGLGFEPDLVLICLYANDVADDYTYSHIPAATFDSLDLPLSFPARSDDNRFRLMLHEHSRLYRSLSGLIKPLLGMTMRRSVEAEADIRSDFMAIFKDGPLSEAEEAAWALTRKYLLAMKRLAGANGAGVAVVIVPPGIQVSPDEFKEGKKALGFSPDEFVESTAMQDRIKGIAASGGIPVLDLLPAFRMSQGKGHLYYPYDGHWNPEGNALAAEEIFSFLGRLKVLP